MKDVWAGTLTPKLEKICGKYPTQKSEYLLERTIPASTREGDLVPNPFMGSGTTAVVAKRLGRYSIGIDSVEGYLEIAGKRLAQTAKTTMLLTEGDHDA